LGNIDEISATNLAPYVGDLAISSNTNPNSGIDEGSEADIFIVRWNSTTSNFDVNTVAAQNGSSIYEGLTFAPIDLSPQ
jgi:hypothetical protein